MNTWLSKNRSKRRRVIAALLTPAVLAMALPARAAITYGYTQIVSGGGQFPAINNGGVVAFQGQPPNSIGGVYTSNKGTFTYIGGGTFGVFDIWINDSAQVAFVNNTALNVFSVDRGAGDPLTIIHTYSASPREGTYALPVIANDGTVTYVATNTGIFAGTGGAVTPISTWTSTYAGDYQSNFGLAVAHNGTLAYENFTGSSIFPVRQIITSQAGNQTVVATLPSGGSVNSISVNNKGQVAMTAVFEFGNAGLYLGDGTNLITLVNDSSSFQVLGNASINDSGEVAFLGDSIRNNIEYDGIYIGTDPVEDKVIETGDALDGSTVTQLSLGTDAFNDNGQIVFWAQLADGTSGIFVASTVPEPASVGILAMVSLPLLLSRRRKAANAAHSHTQ